MHASSSEPSGFGHLAWLFGGIQAPLQVLRSAGGFYVGTCVEGLPFSRESTEYWCEAEQADIALRSSHWTQKRQP